MKNLEQEMQLQIHPRPKETVSIEIPKDTLESLQKIADSRDMSLAALLKLYIGQGLRQDLAKSFSNRVLEITEQVLLRHIQSEEEISNIIQEIQAETTSPPGVKTLG